MKRSALTYASLCLVLAAPLAARAQDTTPPAADAPPAAGTPTDAAAPTEGAPAQPSDDDEQQAATQAATTQPSGEGATDLQRDMAEAEADEVAETTPIPPVAQEQAEQEEEKLPFRGSIFLWDHSFNAYGLIKSAQLSWNPTYQWWFSLRPRWWLNEDYYVSGRFDLYYELTDSDSTTTNHELVLGDAIFGFGWPKAYEIEGVRLGGTASLTLPFSIASRAAGLLAGTGVSVRATREFEVLEGLSLDAALGYTHNWHSRNVVAPEDAVFTPGLPSTVASPGGGVTGRCSTATREPDPNAICGSGSSNVSESITFALTGSLSPIEKLTIDLSYTWWWRLARGLEDAYFVAAGREYTIEDASETHWRNLQVFSVSVGYDVMPWLNTSFSFGALTSQLNPDGSFRNPLFNYDSSFSLTATVALDELYKVFRPTRQTEERNPTATAARRPQTVRQ